MLSITRYLVALYLILHAAHGVAADLVIRVVDGSGKTLPDVALALFPVGRDAPSREPETVDLVQYDKTFVPLMTVIRTGDAVSFPNHDKVRHHVYSFSTPKVFELKLYLGRPSAPVVFDKPGLVVLGCNIHDHMVAYVVVSDTPWNAVTGADGMVRFDGIPAGDYELQYFRPGQIDVTVLARRAVKVRDAATGTDATQFELMLGAPAA